MNTHLIISTLALLISGCESPKSNSQVAQLTIPQNTIAATAGPIANEKSIAKRNVEMVFCLDATGSMGGLIGTAKEKIWNIVSDMAQSNDVDTLKMGMVFYRDRGDGFVTKQIQLTTNLDNVYADLLEMTANGGGDSPESVNQALNESVNNMIWSKDKSTYKTIFVVGDCPPHMDYQDDVKYTVSCMQAARKGIVINTIKLGNSCRGAVHHFKKMAECSNGEYLQLDQNASDYVVKTPYDEDINNVSKKIDDSRLYYGNQREQSLNNENKRKSMEIYEESSITANSARATYKSSKAGKSSWMGSKEIVKDFEKGEVELDKLKDDELPKELRGKTTAEKEQILKEKMADRESNLNELKELSEKRKKFIDKKMKEKSEEGELSFSREVIEIMKEQSKRD